MDDQLQIIQNEFAGAFASWGIALPVDDVRRRRSGTIAEQGWLIQYLFGRDDHGEFLDYLARHRMTEDDHFRIHADGHRRELPTGLGSYFSSPDPEVARELEARYVRRERFISHYLETKGFGVGTRRSEPRPWADDLERIIEDRVYRDDTPRILIVDHEPGPRQDMVSALEWVGYRVGVCGDSQAALAAARGEPHDVCFVNRGMTVIDGESTAREVAR